MGPSLAPCRVSDEPAALQHMLRPADLFPVGTATDLMEARKQENQRGEQVQGPQEAGRRDVSVEKRWMTEETRDDHRH